MANEDYQPVDGEITPEFIADLKLLEGVLSDFYNKYPMLVDIAVLFDWDATAFDPVVSSVLFGELDGVPQMEVSRSRMSRADYVAGMIESLQEATCYLHELPVGQMDTDE